MKAVQSEDAKTVEVSSTCTAIEYPLNDKDINAAVIKISGRYPSKGRTMNEECKELAYVMNGTGKLTVESKTIDLRKGTMVLILPGERFHWEGKELEMFMPCTPAWYPRQHKEVK